MRVRAALYSLCFHLSCSIVLADDWTMFGRDPQHQSYNAEETTITRENVGNLELSWTSRRGGSNSAAITLVDGRAYYGSWDGQFYAVDASNGQMLWQQFVGVAPPPESESCFPGIGVAAQVVVVGDVVYVPGGDSTLYALDKENGRVLWSIPVADPSTGAFLWSSVTRAGDNYLFLGVASLGDCPLSRGALIRVDLRDPMNPEFRYLTPPDTVGSGIWSTPAYDAETDTVYVTTGTGDQNPENDSWGSALMAIDATSLQVKAYYLLPTHSLEDDIEWGSSPTIFTSPQGRKLVAATGKDGAVYALDANDLTVVWVAQVAVNCICPECGCGALSTPSYDGKYLYAGSGVTDPELFEDGGVHAFDPDTGERIWSYPIFGIVIAPTTVANGMLFASTTKGLKVFDTDTGAMLFSNESRGPIYSQPVVAGGTVYCTYVRGDAGAWRVPE